MQLLGFPPRAAIPIFAQVFNHHTHILEMTNPGIGMSEPKTFRMIPHQRPRPLDQLRRRRSRRGIVMHGIRPTVPGRTLRVGD
jgi:hypothetical protein